MAHIALVRAPFVCSTLAYSAEIEPPLGMAYIAAAFESAGNEVTVIDSQGEAPEARHPAAWPGLVAYGLTIEEIVRRIPARVDGIGVSIMYSQQWPHAEALVNAIHARFPATPLFLGGEHATATWEFIFERCPGVTACVLGEGELAAIELAEWMDGRRALDSISGLAIRDAQGARRTVTRPRVRKPETLPWPAWHLFPLEAYFSRGLGQGVNRGRSLPMLATRGCPFQCTFCSSPAMWTTRYVARPVADLVDEIETYVRRYNISNVDFEDLTAFIKRGWILEFCAEIARRGLKVTFQLPSGTRSEALDREVLEALYRAGVRNITYAPESGSARTLERIKKKIHLDRMLQSMRDAVDVGMIVKVNMVIGFPFEDRQDILDTLRFCLKLAQIGVDDIPLYPFLPYPGSELYEGLRREGVLPPLSNDYFVSLTFNDLTRSTRVCREIGPKELGAYRVAGMVAALAAGYALHPKRVLRTVRNLARGEPESMVENRLASYFGRREQEPLSPPSRAWTPPTNVPRPVSAGRTRLPREEAARGVGT